MPKSKKILLWILTVLPILFISAGTTIYFYKKNEWDIASSNQNDNEHQQSIDAEQANPTVVISVKNKLAPGQAPQATDITFGTVDGLTFKFKSAKAIDDNGNSQVTYIISGASGTKPKEVTRSVSGFTTKQDLIDASQPLIDAEQANPTVVISVKNKLAPGQAPQATDITFGTVDGLTFKFKSAKAIDDNGNSEVAYIISGASGTTPKEVTRSVSGFTTKQDLIDASQALIDAEAKNKKVIISPLKSKQYHAKPENAFVSFSKIPGLSFSITSAKTINAKGESEIEYEIKGLAGTKSKTVTKTFSGFQTAIDFYQALIDAEAKTPTVTVNVNNKLGPNIIPTANDLSFIGSLKELEFEFIKADKINDDGTAKITYKISNTTKGTQSKEIEISLDKFNNLIQASQDAIDAEKANPTVVISVKNKLAPGIGFTKGDITFSKVGNLKFTIINEKQPISNSGDVQVVYVIEGLPGTKKSVNIVQTVSGFNNINDIHQALIDAEQANPTVVISVKNKLFPGQAPQATDITFGTVKGLTFKFKSAKAIDDNGNSQVTYIISGASGTTPKEVTRSVGGFTTKQEIDNMQKLIDSEFANPSALKLNKFTSELKIGETPRAKDITFGKIKGLTFKFKSAGAIDVNGETTIEYEVSSIPGTNSKVAKKSIKIFKDVADVKAEILGVFKDVADTSDASSKYGNKFLIKQNDFIRAADDDAKAIIIIDKIKTYLSYNDMNALSKDFFDKNITKDIIIQHVVLGGWSAPTFVIELSNETFEFQTVPS